MNCWICGQNADSGEHRTKKSDLGLVFPNVSLGKPIYTKTKYNKWVKINSLDSDRFKSTAKICQHCNTTRTQPFDQAWEQLSAYLQENTNRLRLNDSLPLHKVFPGRTKEAMLYVHLFFVKIFGCLIIEHKIPIPIEPFSQAILNHSEHPKVYIGIGYLQKVRGKNIVQISPIESVKISADPFLHFANWQYIVKEVFVDISFSYKPEYTAILRNVWQPSDVTKKLRFSKFAPIHNLSSNHIFK
ncbi:MAG: hypothetical protein K2Y09_10495 [Nitrosomonas sp.]|uniref:hypothetical protein n=1 Tax=Nitrosomonas sp. TaxID=42353 RepID=UPI001D2D5CBC|nr:hypothetical protein [Nitrosomonas sp.]MBX9895594.1 hypothetical protein [Nitrosomonas sp.]